MQEFFFSHNAGCLNENLLICDPKIKMHTFVFFNAIFCCIFNTHFRAFPLEYVLKIQKIFNAFFCRILTFYDARFLLTFSLMLKLTLNSFFV